MVSNDESMRCETCLHNSGSSGHSSFMKAFKVVNGNAPQSACIHCMLGSRWRRIESNWNKMEKSLPYAILLHSPLSLPVWTVRNNSEHSLLQSDLYVSEMNCTNWNCLAFRPSLQLRLLSSHSMQPSGNASGGSPCSKVPHGPKCWVGCQCITRTSLAKGTKSSLSELKMLKVSFATYSCPLLQL